MDGNGALDIVTSNSILLEKGNAVFQTHPPLRPTPIAYFVTGGDFDGDGNLDLAFAHWDSDEIAVYRNEGNAVFAPPVGFATARRPTFLATADLDGDGLPDLLAAHEDLDLLLVLRNRSRSPALPLFHRGDSNADGQLGPPGSPCGRAADARELGCKEYPA